MGHIRGFRRRSLAHWTMLGAALALTAAVPLALGGLLKILLAALG
jgi:hypothetical protein